MRPDVYTFETWVMALPWVFGVLFVALAAWIFLRSKLYWWTALFPVLMALLLFGVVGPDMRADRIEVSDDGFFLRTGFWFSPNEHGFRFSELTNATVLEESDHDGGRTRYVVVTFKTGDIDRVPIGDLFRAHQSAVFARMRVGMEKAGARIPDALR